MGSTISTNDLKTKIDQMRVTVVETLASERYREAHIPGALNKSTNSPLSCCPTRTQKSSHIGRTHIDMPANTPPVHWRPWGTRTWRTIQKASRAGWKLGFR